MRNRDLDFKLEDILPKFSDELQKKILHSVELIRKAEPLALAYDPDNGRREGIQFTDSNQT